MKSTQVVVSKNSLTNYSGDLLVCLITVNEKEALDGNILLQPILNKIKKLEEFRGKQGELLQLYPPFGNANVKIKCKRLLLIGIGRIDKLDDADKFREILRTTGGLIAQQCKKNHVENVCISGVDFLQASLHSGQNGWESIHYLVHLPYPWLL